MDNDTMPNDGAMPAADTNTQPAAEGTDNGAMGAEATEATPETPAA